MYCDVFQPCVRMIYTKCVFHTALYTIMHAYVFYAALFVFAERK